MLVLTRKKGESIFIGDAVEVVVLGSEGDTVKIGIKAPKNISIYRSEIYEMIQESNREATKSMASIGRINEWMRKTKENPINHS
ncbi:carbon storage regulator CsrA [Paenibacillus ginsengarvi]|uniref:Translational regulator CsrA n=1 Tax=Paenibacillus ginsengarvi TaxID=400777 RepID=A0A3B0C2V4_9BACL|nr:carbon storage regulator CsrA [Paenibacillus ginsengarvi]RKN78938.1 carbon storage regulator [Paenibacillus ginsengarvi]